ncbi:MAG: glycosyltransferase family 4 protein [Solirubrobacterales bacterium]
MTPSDRIRVGLNLVFLGERAGGIGRYAEALLERLAIDDDVELSAFVSRDAPRHLFQQPWSDAVEWIRLPVRLSGPPTHLVAQLAMIPAEARRRGLQVVHSPANSGPLRTPGCAHVLTLHDLVWIHYPEQWETRRAARSARALSTATARRADLVIADSTASRDDFVQTLGLDSQRISVVALGVDPPRVAPTPEPEVRDTLGFGERPLILCVSQKRPYKNQEALIRALVSLPEAGLVVPGAATSYEQSLRELAAELGVADRVAFPSWVSDADLEGLYAASRCFALPSLFEGFGLPVLEAMARGLPVVCSDAWSLPEVAGQAALLVDATNHDTLARAIRRVLDDAQLRDRLVRAGHARAATFSWDRTGTETVAAYRRSIESRR